MKTLITILGALAFILNFGLVIASSKDTAALALQEGGNKKTTEALEAAAKIKVQESYGKLPLSFIQNDGQADKSVAFYERGLGHATYFRKDGVYLSLQNGSVSSLLGEKDKRLNKTESESGTPEAQDGSRNLKLKKVNIELVKLIPLGANKNPKITSEGLQKGKVNYFIGNDPKKWRANVATYKAVLYKELYPGVDLKFYGNNRQMEYDLIVKPGADFSKVRMAYEGIERLMLTKEGNLEIGLREGTIIQKRPVFYQEIKGNRVNVKGDFKIGKVYSKEKLTKQFTYSFTVASYNKDYPLIIDPTLIYSTYLGGSGVDTGSGIAVDSSGNTYVTGYSYPSMNFPVSPGTLQSTSTNNTCPGFWNPCPHAFVTKLNSAGTALVYSTFLGGNGADLGSGIAVNPFGQAYVSGLTNSTNFPTTPGAFQLKYPGGNCSSVAGWNYSNCQHVFVSKLDATGSTLIYSTYLGGTNTENIGGYANNRSIALDSSGNAYVAGTSTSIDFPTTAGAFQVNHPGVTCPSFQYGTNPYCPMGFVTELNSTGSGLIYSTYLGGGGYGGPNGESGTGNVSGITLDNTGSIYVTGNTWSTNFPTTSGAFQSVFIGHSDVFVTKINPSAFGNTSLVYSTLLAGSGSADSGGGIAVNSAGNAFVTGFTNSTTFPVTPGAYQTSSGGNSDAFVAIFNTSGSGLVYSTYLGGNGGELAGGIAVDYSGNVFVTGTTSSSNYPTTSEAFQTALNGSSNAFLAEINPSLFGSASLIYSTYLGGTNDHSSGNDLALDAFKNVYLTGGTVSANFPTTTGSFQTAYGGGGSDAFIAKFSLVPVLTSISVAPPNPNINVGQTQQFTANGKYNNGSTQTLATNVGWSSSNAVVATINGNGLATGLSAGMTTIMATSGSISGTTMFTVEDFSFNLVSPLSVDVGGSASSLITVNSLFGFNLPVTLSVTGVPTGVTTSLSSNPVTPPANSNASSTLALSLSPLVTPSSFTLTVAGASTPVTHLTSVAFTVTVDCAGITNVVGQMLAGGLIDNSGIANALTQKCSAAQNALSGGQIQTAINILKAFINQAQAQSGKHITSAAATALITDATALRDSLTVSLIPDPISGYVVDSSGSGLTGATVSIISGNSAVATTTTDITGFYYIATMNVLSVNSTYTVQVTGFPSGRTISNPSNQTFTWGGTEFTLANFELN